MKRYNQITFSRYMNDFTSAELYNWVPEKYKYLINDPEARYAIRSKYYKRFGADKNIIKKIWRLILAWITGREGFGRSELDFLRWEIDRGTLNPLNDSLQKGSPWWRDVNLKFIIISEEAGNVFRKEAPVHHIDNEMQLWLDYIKERTGVSWYRAHNASIVRGYLECIHQAREESIFEQVFMNEVLYRLLFAQAMEEDDTPFKEKGVMAANPMLPSVDLIVHVPEFYPDHYPLSKQDILNVMHKGHGLASDAEKVFDEYLIYPHLTDLYQAASKWLNIPELNDFLKDGKCIYPHINTTKRT